MWEAVYRVDGRKTIYQNHVKRLKVLIDLNNPSLDQLERKLLHQKLGDLQMTVGQPEQAYDHYQKAVELGSILAHDWILVSKAAAEIGDYSIALKSVVEALKLDPESESANQIKNSLESIISN